LWCRDTILKVAFPVLFGIVCAKDASVAANMEVLGGSIKWNVSFTREAHDWELKIFVSFFQVLYSVRVTRGGKDKLWWISSERGLFKAKALFYYLVSNEARSFPGKSVVARSRVGPSRVSIKSRASPGQVSGGSRAGAGRFPVKFLQGPEQVLAWSIYSRMRCSMLENVYGFQNRKPFS
jgi:hypothetical protein